MISQATTIGWGAAANGGETRSSLRIAAVFEPGKSGAAVLAEAATLGASEPTDLTVVAIVPQVTGPRCCGVSPSAYNSAVRDDAAAELDQAAQVLGRHAKDATLVLLLEGRDPPLPEWILQSGFALVLLPARRRIQRAPSHPAMRRPRHLTNVEVRIVKAPTRPPLPTS